MFQITRYDFKESNVSRMLDGSVVQDILSIFAD